APTFATKNLGAFADFTNIGPQQVLSAIVALGNWLQQFDASPAFQLAIPLTGKNVGDLVHFGTVFAQTLLDRMQTMTNGTASPTFAAAQELADLVLTWRTMTAFAFAAYRFASDRIRIRTLGGVRASATPPSGGAGGGDVPLLPGLRKVRTSGPRPPTSC